MTVSLVINRVLDLELVDQNARLVEDLYLHIPHDVFKSKGHVAIVGIREYLHIDIGTAFLQAVKTAVNPFGVDEFAAWSMGFGAKFDRILFKGKDIKQAGVIAQSIGDDLPAVEVGITEIPFGQVGGGWEGMYSVFFDGILEFASSNDPALAVYVREVGTII